MIRIDTAAAPISEEREPIFSIDNREYTIPVEVPGSLALAAMEEVRQKGEIAASAWCMETLLGTQGYKALLSCQEVTKAQVLAIQEICRERVFGAVEEEGKG